MVLQLELRRARHHVLSKPSEREHRRRTHPSRLLVLCTSRDEVSNSTLRINADYHAAIGTDGDRRLG